MADGSLSDEPFYGAKNNQNGRFGDIIYIPAISKVEEHAKLSGPSVLRDLLNDILSDVVQSGQAYSDFGAAVKTFAGSIRQEETTDGRSLSGFEDELNSLLESWRVMFKLDFLLPTTPEIIKSMLEWDIIDKFYGRSQEIDMYGSGFQRYFIYSLIQLSSRYLRTKHTKKSNDFIPSMRLVLFEEPEAFLHPPQQEYLAANLRELAGNDNWQVVCATHSSHFVSKNAKDLSAIIRLRRFNGEVKAFQISDSDWASIVSANQEINKIAENYPKMKLQEEDAKSDMEAVKYFLWLNPDRSGAFFANYVLLVEGRTEVTLINKLIGDKKINNPYPGMYVLDCMGKYNIHRFMNLLCHLGIPHSVLDDDDHNINEHKKINQLIQDSKDPTLTMSIKCIPGNLEEMLGLNLRCRSDAKPQHVLCLYESRKIDKIKLKSFCELVASCISFNPSNLAE